MIANHPASACIQRCPVQEGLRLRLQLNLRDDGPDQILPGLLLSSCGTEQCLERLRAHKITHILQVGSELSSSHPESFQYLWIDVLDKPFVDIVSHLPVALQFIDQGLAAGGKVLVHCRAGISRSATVVIAYQMYKNHLPLKAAIEATRAARWAVLPNPGFLCQLLEYEQLQYEATSWPGWGFLRWLNHPLRAEAQALHDELSASSRCGGMTAGLVQQGVDMEGVPDWEQQEYVPYVSNAAASVSPFAQLLQVVAAAGAEAAVTQTPPGS